MNCSEFELELEQLVETRRHRLSDPGKQHIDGCCACQGRWQDHRMIEAALQTLPPVKPPVWMADAVVQSLLRDRLPADSHLIVAAGCAQAESRGKWIVVTAVAVCLMAVIGLGLQSRDQSQQTASGPSRAHSIEPTTVEVATSVVAVFDDLRAEYRELAAETSASARDFAAVLPPSVSAVWRSNGLVPRASSQSLESPSGVDGDSSRGAVSKIGRSIGDQIGQAMDFLWAAVPETVPRG